MVDPFGGIAPGFLGGGNEGDVTSTSFEERDASRESDSVLGKATDSIIIIYSNIA